MVDVAALPQELIDSIVDEIGAKKPMAYTTLAACSLTARAFVERSQRHLFRSLTLTNEMASAQKSRTLVASPHIASYVRDLHVYFGCGESLHLPALSLLRLLSQVRRLGISCLYGSRWAAFSATFRACLVGLLSCPSLRCFALSNCFDVPSSIIRHALLSYEEVTLQEVRTYSEDGVFPYANEPYGNSLSSTAPIYHLVLRYRRIDTPRVYAMMLALDGLAPHLERLQHLELPLAKTASLGPLETFVRKTSDSLQHLVIRFSSRSGVNVSRRY
jgi:hypothetical protein